MDEAVDARFRSVIDEIAPARVVGWGLMFVERPTQLGNQFTKFDPI
jgi:hypothetical protein